MAYLHQDAIYQPDGFYSQFFLNLASKIYILDQYLLDWKEREQKDVLHLLRICLKNSKDALYMSVFTDYGISITLARRFQNINQPVRSEALVGVQVGWT